MARIKRVSLTVEDVAAILFLSDKASAEGTDAEAFTGTFAGLAHARWAFYVVQAEKFLHEIGKGA